MNTDAQAEARPPWRAVVVTLFPDVFPGPLAASNSGTALSEGRWSLTVHDLRDHGIGRHRSVDDTPAGGGAGMVLRADVVGEAIDAARDLYGRDLASIYLSPRGEPLTQEIVGQLANGPGILLLAGRFEGVDQRVIDGRGLREISIGDYVLSGGEIAAMALIDACTRLLPGVIGAAESLTHETFEDDLLEYPQYTRPRSWEGQDIPDVLLSGDHAAIEAWRQQQAEALTRQRRPDLWRRRSE